MLSRTCRFIHRTGCAQLFSRTHCAGGVLNSRLSDNNSCHGATQRHFHTSKALLSKDYYKLLGVTKSSTAKEIKKAYYELAKTHHPDVSKSKDSEKKFQEISEAYEVLGDDSKKKEYDQFGGSNPHNPFGGGGQSQQYQYRQHQGEQMSAEDLFKQAFGGSFDFESMFGNERPSSRPSMGRYEMTISFIEACVGVTRTVTLQFPVQCQNCDGSGGEPGTKQRTCNRCKGAGQTINKVGWYAMQQQCTGCGGTGKVVSQACTGCKGKKTVTINEQAEIKIPAGVDSDTVYKYNTQHGVQIPISLLVEKSKVFQRNDLDVMSTVNIDMVKAVIGGKVEVESLTGKLEVTVPKNTQPGTTVRLAGKGISGKLTGRGKGHHILKLNVIIPKNISRKQQLLFEVYGGNDSNVEELIKMLGGRLPERLESESEDSSKQSHTQSHTQSTSSSSTSEDSSSKEPESESQSKTDAKSDTKDRPERKNSWTEFKKIIWLLLKKALKEHQRKWSGLSKDQKAGLKLIAFMWSIFLCDLIYQKRKLD